jgi:hypothetical protein
VRDSSVWASVESSDTRISRCMSAMHRACPPDAVRETPGTVILDASG